MSGRRMASAASVALVVLALGAQADEPAPAPVAPASVAEPPPAAKLLSLEAAIEQGLSTSFGLTLARHDLASAQSSVLAERNAFDFKLTAHLQDFGDFDRNVVVRTIDRPDPLPDLEIHQDLLTD